MRCTAYVCGPLNASIAAARSSRVARSADVRGVRVDLRGVTVCDVDALMMLEVLLLEWSSERRGVSRIVYPHVGPVTRSLQFRARFETRPTQAYDLTVMIEWS